MKKFLLIIAACSACLIAHATIQVYPGIVWNNVVTNTTPVFNAMVGVTGTNGFGQLTNNVQSGVVIGTSNNVFNLALNNQGSYGVSGSQANTNLWPSVGVNLLSSYPNTYAPPINNLHVTVSGLLMATNTTSTAISFKFAGSDDGVIWFSNYLTIPFTVAVNTFSPGTQQTNIQTGGMAYFALQEIDNPGAAVFTNVTVTESGKQDL